MRYKFPLSGADWPAARRAQYYPYIWRVRLVVPPLTDSLGVCAVSGLYHVLDPRAFNLVHLAAISSKVVVAADRVLESRACDAYAMQACRCVWLKPVVHAVHTWRGYGRGLATGTAWTKRVEEQRTMH